MQRLTSHAGTDMQHRRSAEESARVPLHPANKRRAPEDNQVVFRKGRGLLLFTQDMFYEASISASVSNVDSIERFGEHCDEWNLASAWPLRLCGWRWGRRNIAFLWSFRWNRVQRSSGQSVRSLRLTRLSYMPHSRYLGCSKVSELPSAICSENIQLDGYHDLA